ncbi:type I-E CRISPR-associated endoribonuclease Cas2e [Lactobacillus gallinarum]|uniref:type I-E CRISPR-associated endoribonuclease Cas2e n=1 Tax=Lactobacillus gallinarum TaxID=52242 RepID=UPI00195C2D28|nr:type I-E CRISPR-associated endoribonuclease Cas2e [Lactobacillus gallinarum]MBM6973052.1 type I-E CRISPR-associated endoribonuclease Cas2 [Lactobacillus gallinarum]
MIVITLSKVPASLRGDLTKWCQKVQTGVYVGNFNSKIRDLLWDKIVKNCGSGEATLVYSTNNELGYNFRTTRSDIEVVDCDGIPLVKALADNPALEELGYSKAAKIHKAKVMKRKLSNVTTPKMVVSLDLETTGLDVNKDEIISIGAVKEDITGKRENFYRLIQCKTKIPKKIADLTGISDGVLAKNGVEISVALKDLKKFIGESLIIGYNVSFDIDFLNRSLDENSEEHIVNSVKDMMPVAKKANVFLDDYRLETVLDYFKIKNNHPHNSLGDATATLDLAKRLL